MISSRLLVLLITMLLSTKLYAKACFEIDLPKSPKYTFTDKVYIKSFDGVRIGANVFEPKSFNPFKTFPVIIFVNSWFLEEHEYFKQAKKFAEKGYIVLSYSARGWGCSDGLINVIGDNDMKDLSKVIDWIRDHTRADMRNIGMSGISYGSGMTLRGLAHDSRIKTGVAMSTWGSLTDSLIGNDTLRSFWSALLVGSAFVSGDLDTDIWELLKDILENQGDGEAKKWTELRSPINYVNIINKRNTPIFMANSFGDNLFHANSVIDFYNKLTVPKRLELNQGTHASAEGLGLFYDANYTFDNVHSWFDYWLKGISPKKKLQEVSILTSVKHQRESHSQSFFKQENTNTTFYLSPRRFPFSGKLKRLNTNMETTEDTIRAGVDTLASTGIPLASVVINSHFKTPVMRLSYLLNSPYSLIYKSDTLVSDIKLRGIPKLNINITPHSDQVQLVTYLYDVNPFGVAKLITHGVMTKRNLIPHKDIDINLDLVANAYDLKKGHKLTIVIDTFDLLYLPLIGNSHDFDVNFNKEKSNTLSFFDFKKARTTYVE